MMATLWYCGTQFNESVSQILFEAEELYNDQIPRDPAVCLEYYIRNILGCSVVVSKYPISGTIRLKLSGLLLEEGWGVQTTVH